jgi:farnesyl-diphosphate farnesyltransferase
LLPWLRGGCKGKMLGLAVWRGAVHECGLQMSSNDESVYEKELGGQLLASVSRSFYLTLKALPRELREPISLAYLLARTADTIADTAEAPAGVRLVGLETFARLVQSPVREAAVEGEWVAELRQAFAPHQTDEAERQLMEKTELALAWMRTMTGAPRRAITEVLQRIIEGQRLDIERFPADGTVRALETAEALDDYTWRVAGCVGEFWTRLCGTELEAAFAEGVPVEEMVADGVRMGKALQLVNILRDVGKDFRMGRCYLPESELRAAGVADLVGVMEGGPAVRGVWAKWATEAEGHLEAGLRYVCRLTHGKLRYATALPLLLAYATFEKLRAASWKELLAGVKLSRLEVARLLAETLVANRSSAGLEKLARRWRR